MNSHPEMCRCTLHATLQAQRDACYRQLAQTILGPNAPTSSAALAHALADHARSFAKLPKAA